MRIPQTAKRSNQSSLKEINPEYSLKGPMLKLKLQYVAHLMQRASSSGKTDSGKDWRQKGKGVTENEMSRWHPRLKGPEQTPGDYKGQRSLARCRSRGRRVRQDSVANCSGSTQRALFPVCSDFLQREGTWATREGRKRWGVGWRQSAAPPPPARGTPASAGPASPARLSGAGSKGRQPFIRGPAMLVWLNSFWPAYCC